MNDQVPTPEEAKSALLRLSLALPIFEIDRDVFNAASIAAIAIENHAPNPPKMVVYLQGNQEGIYYYSATPDETLELHAKAVADWKAALSKLYV